MILGIDEVGRGSWAGPLVVGAVVLGDTTIEGLTDSKKLTKKQREALDLQIRSSARGYGLGWVMPAEIDQLGLSASLRLATIRAVEQITVSYHEIIIDGTINFLSETGKGRYVTTLKKADLLIPSVSAAAIIAKVARDAYMKKQDSVYPGYKFGSHVGYGTAAHRQAIERLGVTPLHRLSFAPLAKYRQGASSDTRSATTMTTKEIGDRAEDTVAAFLKRSGHTILARNWRTKFCEIDIVSSYADTVYFTEVKYRKHTDRGDGLAAITPQKVRQMTFAAEYYATKHALRTNVRLAAASVEGEDYTFIDWMEI